jgi:RNA polymerase sigma-70 factor (ECF subfamily)
VALRSPAAIVKLVPRGAPAAQPTLDDVEILAAIRRGDASAATALYHRARPQIDRTINRLLGRRDTDHEDLAQISLIELVRSIASFRGECSLDTWTYRVTARAVYRQLRRRSAHAGVNEVAAEDVEVPASGYGDTTREVDARNVVARIRLHLDAMDPLKAWAVLLHDVGGYDLREVAEITECSVAAAQTRLVRGRSDLQERMQADPELASYVHGREARR